MRQILQDLERVREDDGFALTHLVLLRRSAGKDGPGPYRLERIRMTRDVARELRLALLDRLGDVDKLKIVPFQAMAALQPDELEVIPVGAVPALRDLMDQIGGEGGPRRLEVVQEIDDTLLDELTAYAVAVEWCGHRVVYFRRFLRSKVMRAGGPFKFFFDGQVLSKIVQYVFNFDAHVDVLVIGPEAFVFQKNFFEEIFDYVQTVCRPAAAKAISNLRAAGVLSDLAGFEKVCAGDNNKLRKLAGIGQNVDPAKLTWKTIRTIRQKWNVPVDLDEANKRILFTPASTWSILKLLDDDHLRSDMTGAYYEVQSKRRVKRPAPKARQAAPAVSVAPPGALALLRPAARV